MCDLVSRLRKPCHEVYWTGKDGIMREAADEIERLQGIVDKLPKTADQVRVIPAEDRVWHPVWGECVVICNKKARPWETQYCENLVLVSECYSTREAAEEKR